MKDIENSPDDSHGNSEAVYELPDSVKENQAGQESSTYMALKDDKEPDNVYQSLQQKEAGNKTRMHYENSAFTFRSK